MREFIELCEDQCDAEHIILTDDERLELREYESEGLFPSQAPEFIRARRLRAERRRIVARLKDAGHSAEKALEVALDYERGQQHAKDWLRQLQIIE